MLCFLLILIMCFCEWTGKLTMIKFYHFILLVVAPMCVPVLWKSTLEMSIILSPRLGTNIPTRCFCFFLRDSHQVTRSPCFCPPPKHWKVQESLRRELKFNFDFTTKLFESIIMWGCSTLECGILKKKRNKSTYDMGPYNVFFFF